MLLMNFNYKIIEEEKLENKHLNMKIWCRITLIGTQIGLIEYDLSGNYRLFLVEIKCLSI